MSSTRTTNSSRSLKMPSPPLSLSSSSLSPTMAASSCFWARCKEVILGGGGSSSGEAGDSGEGMGDSFCGEDGGGGEVGAGGVAGGGRVAGWAGGGDGDVGATGLKGWEYSCGSSGWGRGEGMERGGRGEWQGEEDEAGDGGAEGGSGVAGCGGISGRDAGRKEIKGSSHIYRWTSNPVGGIKYSVRNK